MPHWFKDIISYEEERLNLTSSTFFQYTRVYMIILHEIDRLFLVDAMIHTKGKFILILDVLKIGVKIK